MAQAKKEKELGTVTAAPTYRLVPVDDLVPAKRNARTHGASQVAAIAASMKAFGAINPVIADPGGRIVAGHARWEAAKQLGLREVPVIRVDHLGEDQLRLYAIADNRLAEQAGWDESILAVEFAELELSSPGLDLSVTGFELPRIDWMCARETQETWSDLDRQPATTESPVVTRAGDTWLLGEHRLTCGDSTSPAVVARLMDGDRATVVATDPPYNLPAAHYSGNGKVRHGDFAMAAGEMSRAEFTTFLARAIGAALPSLVSGALIYAFMDWKHVRELIAAGDELDLELLNVCVWDKGKGGMGAFYRSAHELACVFRHGKPPHKNRVMLGKHGRNRTNIWRYPGMNTFTRGRDKALAMHATVKPVSMLCDLLLDSSERGDVVFDGFGGSGSTLIAAERVGRRARLVELDGRYCDTIVRRYCDAFGAEAVHAVSGETFEDMAAARVLDAGEAGRG